MLRIENGETPPGPDELVDMLEILGAAQATSEEILALAGDTSGNAWLAVTLPEQRAQLAALLDFEQIATHITNVAPLLIPGLLQSSGYARAVMRAAGVPDDEVESRVAMRMGRRDIPMRAEPTHLLAISTTSLVHMENQRSGLFLNDEADLAAYTKAVEETLNVTLDAEQTAALIAREAERIRRSA